MSLHDWLADRIPWVQYPRQTLVTKDKPRFFKHDMPIWKRSLLISFACLALCFGMVATGIAILIFWTLFEMITA